MIKRLQRIAAICLAIAVIMTAASAQLQAKEQTGASGSAAIADLKGLNLNERMTYFRAMDSAIWAMPLINFKSMRDGLKRDAGVGFNDVAYNSKVQNWKLQFTTNNNTTPYVFIFWNVQKGPVVIDLPAATKDVSLVGTLMDAWQRSMVEVGATGQDSGRGGKYLLLPPGYRDHIPEGYIVVDQPTYNGFTVLRPVIGDLSDTTLAKAVKYVKMIQVYPLAQADKQPATRHIDIYDKAIDGVPHFDLSYFDQLSKILDEEILEEKNLTIMGMLKNIGIEKGKDFAPTGAQKKLLEMAIRDTHTYLKTFYLDYSADPYYEGKNWSNASPRGSATTYMTWEYPNYIDYVTRDSGYYAFYTSFKKLGTASAYLKVSRDKEGKRLNGSNSYKLTVPKDVPVKDFWSVIAYTADDATWFDNQPKAGVASIDAGVVQNPDGTTDVYFSAKAPERKEANWVPTTEGMDYFLYFRLYGPKGPFFDKSWQLPDLVKIQ